MAWSTTWWKRSHEGLRGARRFIFVSHLFAKFHRTLCVGFCLFGRLRLVLVCVGLFCLCDGLVSVAPIRVQVCIFFASVLRSS